MKVLISYNNGVTSEVRVLDHENGWDTFGNTVGNVLTELITQCEGITGLIVKFDEGDGPFDMAVANFTYADGSLHGPIKHLAEVNLVAE